MKDAVPRWALDASWSRWSRGCPEPAGWVGWADAGLDRAGPTPDAGGLGGVHDSMARLVTAQRGGIGLPAGANHLPIMMHKKP